MKKFKKVVSLILVSVLSLSVFLTGCGKNEAKPANSSNNSGVTTQKEDKKETDWPKKPITFVIPAKPGGDTDFNGRAYTKYLEKELGQSVAVVNVDGASNTLAVRKVKEAAPDGYTILVYHNGMILNQLTGLIDYGFEAFEMGGIGAVDEGNVFVVNKDSKYNTLKDLVEDGKANPKNIRVAVQPGGIYHMLGYMLQGNSGAEFNLVDAGGAADKNVALKGKKIDVALTTYGAVKGFVESGDFRVIAVASEKRNPKFSDVPTAKEQGYDIVLTKPYFFLFPRGTPKEIAEKFNKALNNVASSSKEYAEEIDKAYMLSPNAMNIQDSTKYMDDQFKLLKEYYDKYMKK